MSTLTPASGVIRIDDYRNKNTQEARMNNLSLERREGVAVLWIDVKGEALNTLKIDFAEEVTSLLDTIKNDTAIKAVVVASKKSDNFIAGADIEMFKKITNVQEGVAISRSAQNALNYVADFPKPIVAAIHGACLGGGLEFALACHGRVASDHKKTQLGLPEVQLGLIPGAGGTQRLPRLIDLDQALDLILTGKKVDGKKAKKLGLVDDVVPESILVAVATERALSLANKGHLSNLPHRKEAKGLVNKAKSALLQDNPLGRKVVFSQARKQTLSKTQGNYPAPLQAIDIVELGLSSGITRGLEEEAKAFGELTMTSEARSLIHLFFASTALKKNAGPDAKLAKPIARVAVLGAGLMGSGIAYVSAALADANVVLKDLDDTRVRTGLSHIGKELSARRKRKRLSSIDQERILSKLHGSADYAELVGVELIIEAVFEDLKLKHRVIKEVETACGTDVIFASNTSAIPITDIAKGSSRPEHVIGMHYFSPVEKMPLLEIIVTKQTAPWVAATCVEHGKKQGKTVIVVNDGPGFYTSRILAGYMNEAAHVLAEGAAVETIDAALTKFGFPVGPMVLLDEVGIDVGAKVSHQMFESFGDRMKPPAIIDNLLADKRLGRKNQRGMYVYSEEKKKGDKEVDTSVYKVLGVSPTDKLSQYDIAERCALQMINEAALCLQEGILNTPRDGDIGAVFGLGFPPFRGGPFHYVDLEGAEKIVNTLKRYEQSFGARFKPAQILVDMASSGKRFY